MVENKAFASLSSGLLARKGTAKPAMRPQGFGSFGSSLEDLGWNDMGNGPASLHDIHEAQDLPEHVPSSIEALTPAPGGRTHVEPPAVVEQQRELQARLAPVEILPEPEPEPEPQPEAQLEAPLQPEARAEPESEPQPQPDPEPEPAIQAPSEAPVVKLHRSRAAPARAPAAAVRAKAAFTLRLDPERHLKLRLACALSRRSAQQLVTEALDDFLDSLPELEALSRGVPGQANQR
jgi:outer membrane biosynthesis protein TonB